MTKPTNITAEQMRKNYQALRNAGMSSALANQYKRTTEKKIQEIIKKWEMELENYAIK